MASRLSLNAANLLIDVNLFMTELDNYLPRTKADLQIKARLPKATGHTFISLLRHSPCSLRHHCGGSQPYSSNLYPPPRRGVRFGAQRSDTERQGPLWALNVSVTGGGCCYWLILCRSGKSQDLAATCLSHHHTF